MWSIPPTYAWRWQCACYVSTWFSRVDLSCTLRLFKYEHWIVELVNSGIEGSCNPTQLVVFIIQQEGVEYSIYLFILLCDQCWECPLVKVWSLGLVPKYCYRCLFTVLLHLYFLQYHHHQPQASPGQQSTFLVPLLLLILIHTTCISLSLRRTSAPIRCVGDTRDFLLCGCRVAWEGYLWPLPPWVR